MTFPYLSTHRTTAAFIGLLLLILAFSLSACGTASSNQSTKVHAEPLSTHSFDPIVPVVRYGRYTLVELAPIEAQRNLMAQIVDLTIPQSKSTTEVTVGDAMRYVLLRSGYQLCDSSTVFDLLPLPVVHAHLGPMQLGDALMILAGPTWVMQLDQTTRQVCFTGVWEDEGNKNEKLEPAI